MIYLSTSVTSGIIVVCYFLVSLLKSLARIVSVNRERTLTVSCTLFLWMTQEIFSVDKIVTNFFISVQVVQFGSNRSSKCLKLNHSGSTVSKRRTSTYRTYFFVHNNILVDSNKNFDRFLFF